MAGKFITALMVGIVAYGVSLYLRGGLSGRPTYDIVHAVGMIGIVAGIHFWMNRKQAA